MTTETLASMTIAELTQEVIRLHVIAKSTADYHNLHHAKAALAARQEQKRVREMAAIYQPRWEPSTVSLLKARREDRDDPREG
jgi:hypothetical protein